MSDIFDDIDPDVIDEIKDGIKEFLKCGICNSRIKVSTKSNTCHFCDYSRDCTKFFIIKHLLNERDIFLNAPVVLIL